MTRRIWIQIVIFCVVSLTALTVMALGFVQLPSLVFGVDRYTVTVELPEAGGLYDRSNVTYRGTEVGEVKQVDLTDNGVEATSRSIPVSRSHRTSVSRCTARALSASSMSRCCRTTAPLHR